MPTPNEELLELFRRMIREHLERIAKEQKRD